METAIRECMECCGLSYEDAEREVKAGIEMLTVGDEITITDVEEFCLDYGIDEETLFSNPEMLLACF